jgi:transposase-like protein
MLKKRGEKMANRAIKRYSESFKIQVVREYEAGNSITELQKKYGITGGQTIQAWIKKYAREGLRHKVMRIQTAEEVDRICELEAEVKELKEALVKVSLEKLALESILEVLQETGVITDEVKKNAVSSSNGSGRKLVGKKGSS